MLKKKRKYVQGRDRGKRIRHESREIVKLA
jgi:hypothetical protein